MDLLLCQVVSECFLNVCAMNEGFLSSTLPQVYILGPMCWLPQGTLTTNCTINDRTKFRNVQIRMRLWCLLLRLGHSNDEFMALLLMVTLLIILYTSHFDIPAQCHPTLGISSP